MSFFKLLERVRDDGVQQDRTIGYSGRLSRR